MSALPPPFAIRVEHVGDGSVCLRVSGELELSTSPELGEALRRELSAGRSVVLDLAAVTFIDSTGLNTLIRALKSCERNGGSLALRANLPAQISRVFEITGVDMVIPIAPTGPRTDVPI